MHIVWFREDLRLIDNPALFAAANAGEEILCVYVYSTKTPRPLGAASKWWLHHALASLAADLRAKGGELHLAKGNPVEIISTLAQKHTATTVHFNRIYDAHGLAESLSLRERCERNAVAVDEYNGGLLHPPELVLNKSGTPFKVFTPFKNTVFGMPKRTLLPIPHLTFASVGTAITVDDLRLLPTKKWDSGLYAAWPDPTERGAHKRLNEFLSKRVGKYKAGRDIPSLSATSRLSPYLRFGQISPITLWHKVQKHIAANGRERESAEHFLSELCWREFSYHLLFSNPYLATKPLREEFAHFPWKKNEHYFDAWTKGQTGIPIIDAGMRELWATGYMHNRVRMIVASYLVKNLGIEWQKGEEWFWDTLVDADLANNAASWQWVAGCGADAAPFFRIFNPVLQSEKFDPDGRYIKRWVPELSNLSGSELFAPWQAHPSVLNQNGIILGETYPNPLIDLKKSREAALSAYKNL